MVSKYLLFWEKVVEVSCRHLSQNGLALIFCFPTQLDILFSASKNNFLANFYFPHGFFCIIFLNWDWKYPIFWYPTPHGQWALKWDSRVHAAQLYSELGLCSGLGLYSGFGCWKCTRQSQVPLLVSLQNWMLNNEARGKTSSLNKELVNNVL